MNESESYRSKHIKNKLSPLKLGSVYKKKNYSESRKNETNQDNSSRVVLNSIRYIPTFNDSSLDSKNLHIIRKPYKIFLPIKTKIKKIKNSREIFINNYYKRTRKNEYLLKDMTLTDSFNTKINTSKDLEKIPRINKSVKSTFNTSNIYPNNLSKKSAKLSTEATNTTKEYTNFNLSTFSKKNNNSNLSNYNYYDKYKIFSYNNNKSLNNNTIYNISGICSDINNDYRNLKFIHMNQGYNNLRYLNYCSHNFTNQVKDLIKERHINKCLKDEETRIKEYREMNDDNYKLEMKKKLDNHKLYNKFYKDYSTYYNNLRNKSNETDKTDLHKWEIISYKNDINRLSTKKEKLLAKLNKYIQMKNFLLMMKNYSLDIKNGSWIYNSYSFKNDNNSFIKDNRRIKDLKYLSRSKSQDKLHLCKLNDILLNDEKDKEIKRSPRKLNSAGVKKALLGSDVNQIVSILNNHIAKLLIYHNKLRIDLEPLKKEYEIIYNSLKESDEKKNRLLKLQFVILPEKKRIVKTRNEFLKNTLLNINKNIFNTSKYNKMNKIIKEKLYNIYKSLLDYKIITFNYIKFKKPHEDNIVENIFFYLKNIEIGVKILLDNKNSMKINYPNLYEEFNKEFKNKNRIKAIQSRKNKDFNLGNKKIEEISNKMKKSLILNRRKDYYYLNRYKHNNNKQKLVKYDPYEELRYSDEDY